MNVTNKCFISIDGTDCPIDEPSQPVDPKWYSHKIDRVAVRYKVGIAINTGYIIWLNGPFPAGKYSNQTNV